MERSVRNRNQLPTNLPQLQNLIKRDSHAYRDEFLQQYQHYKSLLQLFLLNPAQESKKLEELVMFLCQICNCYRDDMESFPGDLMSLLRQHGPTLEPEIRMILCRGLILMRNRDVIEPQGLLELFFELFRCQDKILRKALYNHIVTDIKRINSKKKNNKVNRGLQSFMYTMLRDSSTMAARMSLEVIIQLYKKNIWNDAKTVNVIASACFSPVRKISVCALKFFLTGSEEGEEEEDASSSESEDESRTMRSYIISKQTSKKGRKKERKMAKALATIKRKHKRKKRTQSMAIFSALHLLNDPQGFSEELFKKLENSKDKFEVRLMMMSLISRLIGLHQLFLFNYYPYLQRYIQPHQKDITKILTYLAQSSHQLVPPEILEPAMRAIVNNFVTERNSSEVMAVGLNTVREICVRCPLAMSEELLRDLTSYKNYKDKSVMMAARSLIHLYRDVNPELLHRKDRGKPTEASSTLKVRNYGELEVTDTIPGVEVMLSQTEEAAALDGSTRFLTQEEFKAIRMEQLASHLVPGRGKKRQLAELLKEQEERREEGGELLPESAIQVVDHAKKRRGKEERLATVMEGREGREKFGSKRRKLNPESSTTNKQKSKKKAFTMIKYKRSIRGKQKKSFREKQISLRNSLLKQRRKK